MKRYYLSRVVGTGAFTDKFRAKAMDLATAAGGNCQAKIAAGAVAGDWCLCVVDVLDHTTLIADTDCRDFPDMTLDALLNTISAQQRNRLLTFLGAAGIDTTGITNTTAFRICVRRAGLAFAPGFSEDAFDVKPAV